MTCRVTTESRTIGYVHVLRRNPLRRKGVLYLRKGVELLLHHVRLRGVGCGEMADEPGNREIRPGTHVGEETLLCLPPYQNGACRYRFQTYRIGQAMFPGFGAVRPWLHGSS